MPALRWRNEQEFHDRQAAQRRAALLSHDYRFTDADYLGHESWIPSALAALGNLHGMRVLDLGCGHGMASVVLARRGARVTACDLSLGYVQEAHQRAEANAVQTQLLVCDGERLPFADNSFPRIWGNAILHHLPVARFAPELWRVLAPQGVAVFCEPWGGNRWLQEARRHLPYPGKLRTADEAPLLPRDLARLRDCFPDLQVQGHQLLAMLGRVIKYTPLRTALTTCDDAVLRLLPHWQRYCRYVVIVLHKPG